MIEMGIRLPSTAVIDFYLINRTVLYEDGGSCQKFSRSLKSTMVTYLCVNIINV